MRKGSEENHSDIDEMKNLVRITAVQSLKKLLTIVEKYYPAKLVTPRTLFGIQEILDAFYEAHKTRRQNMLEREPELLGGKIINGDVTDAYLAATAEYLAWHFCLLTPDWTQDSRRVLKEP